jgi:hypothetical protein
MATAIRCTRPESGKESCRDLGQEHHHHTLQQFTKASPAQDSKRYTGTCLPCMCDLNPGYGRGRANKWVNGFGICSVRPSGDFNLFPIVISDGQFSMPDGQVYGKRHKRAA